MGWGEEDGACVCVCVCLCVCLCASGDLGRRVVVLVERADATPPPNPRPAHSPRRVKCVCAPPAVRESRTARMQLV